MENDKPRYERQQYDRFHKKYTLEEVLSRVSWNGKKITRDFDGNQVKLFSLRLRTFAVHGTVCVTCGLCGEFFALERHLATSHYRKKGCMHFEASRYHFNLYGIDDDGEEILFTKDHIVPKSKGGADNLKNLQTMCIICNAEKGDSI